MRLESLDIVTAAWGACMVWRVRSRRVAWSLSLALVISS